MKKKEIVLLHLLFWFLIINFFMVASLSKVSAGGLSKEIPKLALQVVSNLGTTLILFYASYFTLNFFIRKPGRFIWIAGFYLLLVLGVFFGYGRIYLNQMPLLMEFILAFCSVSVLLSFMIFGFLFRLVIQGVQEGKLRRQLEKEKLTTQLELLKSQLNPHFLFNTLNNVDILIREDPDRASQYLNKLSDILRYSLYETKQETVQLEQEVDNLRKYIDLQKIRTQNPSFAQLTVEGDLTGIKIAPMIFLPFVENAFKHSTNKKIENAIVVSVFADKRTIQFSCRNHCAEVSQLDENCGGLGMNLIRSRFDLLFKDRFSLENKKTGDWYEVNLKIQLDDH